MGVDNSCTSFQLQKKMQSQIRQSGQAVPSSFRRGEASPNEVRPWAPCACPAPSPSSDTQRYEWQHTPPKDRSLCWEPDGRGGQPGKPPPQIMYPPLSSVHYQVAKFVPLRGGSLLGRRQNSSFVYCTFLFKMGGTLFGRRSRPLLRGCFIRGGLNGLRVTPPSLDDTWLVMYSSLSRLGTGGSHLERKGTFPKEICLHQLDRIRSHQVLTF